MNNNNFNAGKALALLLIALFCRPTLLAAQVRGQRDLVPVDVEMSVPAEMPDARREAVQAAMRKAVEEAAGVQVEGGTAVLNSEVRDFISLRTEGYVARWEMMEEGREEDSYRVRMRVWVRNIPLNKDLVTQSFQNLPVRAIYDWQGKPRVAIDIVDLVANEEGRESRPHPLRLTQAQVADIFLERGIRVVEVSPEEWNEPGQTRFDVGIRGTSDTRLNRALPIPRDAPIGHMYFYDNTLSLRATEFPGRNVILNRNYFPAEGVEQGAQARDSAINSAIRVNLEARASEILAGIVRAWYLKLNEPRLVNVSFSGITSGEETDAITRTISALGDVQRVRLRSQAAKRVEYEVEYLGTTGRLAHTMEKNLPHFARVDFRDGFLGYARGDDGEITTYIYLLSVKKTTLAQVQGIQEGLTPRVSAIELVSFARNEAVLNIEYAGPAADLARIVDNLSRDVTVTGYGERRVEALGSFVSGNNSGNN